MTTHQLSANENIQYTSVSSFNANEHSLWRRLLHAIQGVFTKDTVVDRTPSTKAYIHFETTRKETAPFNPFTSPVAYDLNRIV
jgi:hypothetical protein